MNDNTPLVPRPAPSIPYDAVGRAVTIARLVDVRFKLRAILLKISQWPHLPEIERQRMICMANFVGMTLHRVVGAPSPDDAKAMADDLRAFADRVADPFVRTLGEIAVSDLGMSDGNLKLFTDPLFTALDGNALYALEEELPEIMREERDNG